jgi:hypothetical protein
MLGTFISFLFYLRLSVLERNKMYIVSALVALLFRLQLCSAVPQPEACSVHTSSGLVTGKQSSLRPEVNEYLGIPFARPPVGSLRWVPPSIYSGTGAINATQFVSLGDLMLNRV